MKFKNKNEYAVYLKLSKREQERYEGLNELNEIVDFGLPRTVADGEFEIKVNDIPVKLTIIIEENEEITRAYGKMNNFEYSVTKDRPIRKYDIYRQLVVNWKEVSDTNKEQLLK